MQPTIFLSKSSLLHNISLIQNIVGKSKIIAVVKANAYGHGIENISTLLEPFVHMFSVSTVTEAQLLVNLVKCPILLNQGVLNIDELEWVRDNQVHLVLHSDWQIALINKLSYKQNKLHLWLKVNTGMNRLGFDTDRLDELYNLLSRNPHVQSPVKIMSHMACANQYGHPLNQTQITHFTNITSSFETEFSLANSATIFNYKLFFDYVRPGLALYGVSPLDNTTSKDLNLKPVMQLYAPLISINNSKENSYIGYEASYQCHKEIVVGILACGYSHGYPLNSQKTSFVLFGDKKCTILGRISMNMLAIDLQQAPEACIGDMFCLWGRDELLIEHVSDTLDKSKWELLTSVKAVQYHWIK